MKPTMNPSDIKCVLAIFVAASSTLCVATCPENHFQLQESLCCLNCEEGSYVAQNCSRGPRGFNGGLCKKCSICEEIGEITLSQCTQFSDTQCDRNNPVNLPTHNPVTLQRITLYRCSFVIAAVFMVAVIVSACFLIRISKSGESDGSSAGEPFHISI